MSQPDLPERDPEDYWVVLERLRGSPLMRMHAGAGSQEGSEKLAGSIASRYQLDENERLHMDVVNLRGRVCLTFDNAGLSERKIYETPLPVVPPAPTIHPTAAGQWVVPIDDEEMPGGIKNSTLGYEPGVPLLVLEYHDRLEGLTTVRLHDGTTNDWAVRRFKVVPDPTRA